ncbi:D-lysine 5,6-aminomutase subunit alpha [Anoxybacter fermentans]|uniref:D-lysine 5,6-aminomutase subunit alpha n=1 Tax=Anoxybacter fermentans TaxID=1323375 RepID=A0A3S9T0M8_9FIRM|nr:lysine 5,6-aminomutase subunit alpha [Anoxybacter fermentans]AZR74067.1 D-lysine 5,6-aminomutase subunit alpha [Anoxybacter fermentans]
MEKKLNLDQNLIDRGREAARKIAARVYEEIIEPNTTVAVERTVVRLLGVDGVDHQDVPLPNVVVDQVHKGGELDKGIAYWMGNAMVAKNMTAQEVAEAVGRGELNLLEIPPGNDAEIKQVIDAEASKMIEHIISQRKKREDLQAKLGIGSTPLIYVIVATGNIYEDVIQAQAAAKQGADIIAVIRTTAQSLLDYVPYGPTTEGFGGTYATQENFRIMRKALDEVSEEVGRYIHLCNYCSGLCMPEIAAMGAIERLDVMLNDAMYGILFRDINMKRTFIDQHFSRMINAVAGIIINTGEDNYLTTADAVEEAHTVLASQLINEQMALNSNLPEEQMGLGHAFEMNPDLEDGLLMEIAQAQMAREIFPKAPLKYMPPTKYMTGNIFKGHIMDAMFNLTGVLTGQHIQLLGMLTEAIHTPFLQDRALSIENAKYIFNNARHLGDEIMFKPNGKIQKRAQYVLKKAVTMLEEIAEMGLVRAIEKGMFADIKRSLTGGKGLDGVVKKADRYYNPFFSLLKGGVK